MNGLVQDNFQTTFKSYAPFKGFLDEVGRQSSWFSTDVADLYFQHIEGLPLRATDYAADYLCDPAAIEDTMRHTRLLLKIRGEYYPLRNCALKSTLDRVKVSGNSLKKLSKERLANILNWCAEVTKGDTLIHTVAGKASAVLGGDYVILPIPEIFQKTGDYLELAYGKARFIEGYFNHDMTSGLWELPNISGEARLRYKNALESLGIEFHELTPLLRVTSSNTGASGANLYPALRQAGSNMNMRLCPEIKLLHKGNASMKMFMENLKGVHNRIQRSVERLSSLTEIRIQHPANAMLLIYKRLGIKQKYALKTVEKYRLLFGSDTCTAYTLYFDMLEVIQLMKEDPKENDPVGKAIELEEILGRIPFLDFSEYDLPDVSKEQPIADEKAMPMAA